jgi:hypothetical protein
VLSREAPVEEAVGIALLDDQPGVQLLGRGPVVGSRHAAEAQVEVGAEPAAIVLPVTDAGGHLVGGLRADAGGAAVEADLEARVLIDVDGGEVDVRGPGGLQREAAARLEGDAGVGAEGGRSVPEVMDARAEGALLRLPVQEELGGLVRRDDEVLVAEADAALLGGREGEVAPLVRPVRIGEEELEEPTLRDAVADGGDDA